MKLVTPEQMQAIDRETIDKRGIPGGELMERAGRAVAQEVFERFAPASVAVVAGKGNNGGDGYVAARHLREFGVRDVTVFLLADPADLSGDARAAFEKLPQSVRQERVKEGRGLAERLVEYEVIVDAIFGTGLSGPARKIYGEAIEAINEAAQRSGALVVAVDSPSGLISGASDEEQAEAPCVRARLTITIGLPKVGLISGPGVRYTGRVSIADIGFPEDLLTSDEITLNLMTEGELAPLLPPRDPAGHKGSFGRVLVLGGGEGMTGAAILAARAAVRSGTGLVYVGYPEQLGPIFESTLIEPVKIPLPGDKKYFTPSMLEAALDQAEKVDGVAIGPGIGQQPKTEEFFTAILKKVEAPVVIDADGLNLLAKNLNVLKRRPGPTVLTPHPGEAGRLLDRPVKEIQSDRSSAFTGFCKEYDVIVALKGFQTVITAPDGQKYINPSGNSGLAKGGSGDVLTGLIVGLLAQGCAPLAATQLGVFLHGVAGDLAAKKWGPRAMAPGDLPDHFGEAFRLLENRNESSGGGVPSSRPE